MLLFKADTSNTNISANSVNLTSKAVLEQLYHGQVLIKQFYNYIIRLCRGLS